MGETAAGSHTTTDLFDWENKQAGDFPLYSGPQAVSWWGWLIALVGAGLGFALDLYSTSVLVAVAPSPGPWRWIALFLIAILVAAIPLLGLWLAAGDAIRSLFRRLAGRDWFLMVILLLVYLGYTLVATAAAHGLGITTHADTAMSDLAKGPGGLAIDVAALFELPFLLMGETLFILVPFLFFMAVLVRGFNMERKPALVVAAIVAGLLFGLLHFQAYQGDIYQMLVIIGLGQIIMFFGYLKTKNLWVSYLVHLFFDGFGILMTTILAALGVSH